MENKRQWVKIFLLVALMLSVALGVSACQEEQKDLPVEDGPELGMYYYDGDDGQYFIDLISGKEFIFIVKDSNESGHYELNDGTLTFNFNSDAEKVTASLVNDVLTFTYKHETMRFLRKITYTVTFETYGGSDISDAVVWNGRTVAKPDDPVLEGYNFIGWYCDAEFSKLFDFATTTITENTKIYAQWEAVAAKEYEISFDLGYDALMASQTTVSGKLFNLATPEREGFTFKGWWISAYNDAEKLTYQYEQGTVFNADTTLFAVWQKNGETLPALSVNSTGAYWDAQTSAGKLTIEGPDGFKTITKTIGATAGTSEVIDFASAPVGDYKVTFTVNGVTATRWYRNKALDRIWDFRVVNGYLLVFNAVANADKYIISIDCGNKDHVHEEFDNGNSTNYNFSNCDMQEGGIVFTVYAKADGYADSVASKFVYEKNLDEVSGYSFNETTGVLAWNSVDNAVGYIVTVEVNGEVVVDGLDVGSVTNISLKEYSGAIKVSVVPRMTGFNAPEATTYSVNKTMLASPAALSIIGNVLSWKAVDGATSYEIKLDKKIYSSKTNAFDFGNSDIIWDVASDYRISVRAIGVNNSSLWSDEFDARYYAMYQTLKYDRNTVSWRPVIGAIKYEVMVNGATRDTIFVEDGSSSASVTLTRGGYNTVAVRFYDEAGESEWVEIEVFAYTISLDSRGGSDVGAIYLAIGDAVVLPTDTTKLGYEFNGWYNVAGGAAANGSAYKDPFFAGNSDLILYANWSPKTYSITLDNREYAVEGSATEGLAKYNNNFTLPVPEVNTNEKVFFGWYSSVNGRGVKYTDAKGNSLVKWTIAEDGIVLYAYYINLFEFKKDGDYYQVSGTLGVAQISNLIIPESYEGIKVVSVADYAFKGYTSLVTVSLPDTIRTIGIEAFDGCKNITNFEVRDTGEPDPAISAKNGAVIRLNPITNEYDLEAVPLGVSGIYEIPDGVTKIPQKAFNGMSKVTEVIVPASVTSVLKSAFVNCTALKTITFLDPAEGELRQPLKLAVDFIDVNVAKSTTTCAAITTLNLPARLNEIDQSTVKFFEVYSILSKLENINVAADNNFYSSIDGVLCNAGSNGNTGDTILFCPYGKTGTYTVPTQITKIANGAFAGSSSTKHNGLTELVFHGNMLSIGKRAFYYNYSVQSITFKASENSLGALEIGDEAFYYCYKVTSIIFEEEGQLKSREVIDEDGNTITEWYYDATKTCGVYSIGKDAFYYNSVASLVLPSTLRFIDDDAFRSNYSLKELDLSHISANLEFGDRVFNGCTGLKSVDFTKNIGYMPVNSVFYGCTNLAAIVVDSSNLYYSSDSNGVLYNKNKTEISYYPDGLNINYVIPSTVTSIGGAVFKGKSNITSITIPKNVEKIGANAFEACSNLKTLTFEQGSGNPLVIAEKAFYNCKAVTSDIVLPERTTEVGTYAFYYVGTKVLTLNEGLTTIGSYAFSYMKNITGLEIPSTVSVIGDHAFYYCSGVVNLTFTPADSVTEATPLICGNYAFAEMSALVNVVLPERLQYISDHMFYWDTKLVSVTVPVSVGNTYFTDGDNVGFHRGIESNAFYYCTSLSEVKFVTVNELEKSLGKTIPASYIKGLSFGEQVFYNCTKLETLDFPNRLKGVDAEGNADPYNVFQLYVTTSSPYYVTTYNTAFSTYSNSSRAGIKYFTVEEGGDYSSYDGVIYIGDLEIALLCPLNREGEVRISEKATTIAPSAFRYCSKVTDVIIEDPADLSTAVPFDLQTALPINSTTTDVGTFSYTYATNVFFACTALKNISFPARMTEIGDYAFYNGTSSYSTALETVTFAKNSKLTRIGAFAFQETPLTSINLPDSIVSFGEAPFNNCAQLESITLPKSINAELFAELIAGCNSLKKVTVSKDNPYLQEVNGIIYDNNVTSIVYCPADIQMEVYNVPATVTKISDRAFYNIKGIKEIIFEKSDLPLTFGEKAFYLSGIEKIILPARTVAINNDLFWQCYSLKDVQFENGFKADLGSYIFQECSSLETIVIPYTVQSIGDYAFENCTSLVSVTFEDTAQHPSRLQSIGDRTFYGCTAIKEIAIPNSVVYFGADDDEDGDYYFAQTTTNHGGYNFYNCISLEKVVLSDNILYLGRNVFGGCSSLTTLTLPSNLKGLGTYAFADCTALVSITIPDSVESMSATVSRNSTTGIISSVANTYTFDGCTALQYVKLPNKLESIGGYIFRNCASLQSVAIPASVEAIGSYAFSGCTNLSGITFGSNGQDSALTTLGSYAFQNCTSLADFTFPQNIATIGSSVFNGCTGIDKLVWNGGDIGAYAFDGLTSLKIFEFGPNATIKSIGNYAFRNTALTAFEFPSTIQELGDHIFYGCTSLETVIFADGCTPTEIPTYTFKDCFALTSIVLPSSIEEIGSEAFWNCTSLEEINIPAAVKEIGTYAFEYCSNLSKITFEEDSQLSIIRYYAFQYCTSLTTIELPDSLTELGSSTYSSPSPTTSSYVFRGCTSLESVILPNNPNFIYLMGYTFINCNNLKTVTYRDITTGETVGNILPDSVTSVGSGAFQNCKSLESIDLNRAETIGYYAFQYCSNLATVTFADDTTLTSIGYRVFQGCTSLTSIELPNSLIDLGGTTGYVFADCSALVSVILPNNDSFIKLAPYTFQNCINLKTVTYRDSATGETVGNKLPDSVTTVGNYAFYNCKSLTGVDIKSVESLGDYAFRGCGKLTVLYIDKLEAIGNYAVDSTSVFKPADGSNVKVVDGMFYSNTNLILYTGDAETITIPAGITTINPRAFQGNTSLKTVILPDSLETIGSYAFDGCTALTEISIPDSVTLIQSYAFQNCTSLAKVNISQYNSKLETIRYYAFNGCTALENITLPESLLVLGGTDTATTFTYTTSSYVFSNCTSLNSINIPDNLTAIGSYTFDGCVKLATITFGSNPVLEKIGSYAFRNCELLTSFVSENLILTYINTYAFQNCSLLATIDLSEVTYIGMYAFQNCKNLAMDLNLPNVTYIYGHAFEGTSVTSLYAPLVTVISDYAFNNCTSLTKVKCDIYKSSSIYYYQFMGCVNLTEVTMPELSYVGKYMFYDCVNLQSFDGFDNVTGIGEFAFSGCSRLNIAVNLPSVTTIYNSAFANSGITELSATATTIYSLAFENCKNLKSVELSAFVGSYSYVTGYITNSTSLTTSYYGMFRNCTALETISLPKAKYIASYMFSGCSSLITIDASVNRVLLGIGDYAFEGCDSLTDVDFSAVPLSQATYYAYDGIGAYAFADCAKLKTVTVASVANIGIGAFDNTKAQLKFTGTDMVVTTDITYNSSLQVLLKYTGNAKDYTVPGNISTIAAGAFKGNATLQTINTGSVVTIGAEAFEGCTSLTTVVAPNVTLMYANAFADCASLVSVSFPSFVNSSTENTTRIRQFSGCTALTTVDFPKMQYVANSMFEGCKSLTSFDFTTVRYIYASAFENSGLTGDLVLPVATYIYDSAFEGTDISSVKTDSTSTTYIYSRAFANCKNLVTVTLTSYVGSSLYSEIFSGCTSLTTVIMLKATYIGPHMFDGCVNLSDLQLTDGKVTSVYTYAFYGCSSLTSFDFSAVTYIYASAFENSGLTGELILPKATGIYARAFANCTGITSVTLSSFIGSTSYTSTSSSNYTEQFIDCTGITEVVLTKATYIAGSMFKGCTQLTSVEAPVATYVYESAFEDCTKLSTFDMTNLQKLYSNAFKNCTNIASANLENVNYIISNSFAGWTASQTIYIPNFEWEELTESFREYWTNDCQAVVVWGISDND